MAENGCRHQNTPRPGKSCQRCMTGTSTNDSRDVRNAVACDDRLHVWAAAARTKKPAMKTWQGPVVRQSRQHSSVLNMRSSLPPSCMPITPHGA